MGLKYHRITAFLFSKKAKITALPLLVRAVSTPRQPGVSLSALTSSSPFRSALLPGAPGEAVGGASALAAGLSSALTKPIHIPAIKTPRAAWAAREVERTRRLLKV